MWKQTYFLLMLINVKREHANKYFEVTEDDPLMSITKMHSAFVEVCLLVDLDVREVVGLVELLVEHLLVLLGRPLVEEHHPAQLDLVELFLLAQLGADREAAAPNGRQS